MSHYVVFLNISVYLSLKGRVEGSSGAHDPVCSTLHLKRLSARVRIVRNPVSSRVRLRTACWHVTQPFNFNSPFLSVGIAPLRSHRRARFAHPFPSQTTRGLSCSHELPSVVHSGRGAGFWRGDLLSLACFFFSFLDGSGIDDGPSTQFAEVSSAVVLSFFLKLAVKRFGVSPPGTGREGTFACRLVKRTARLPKSFQELGGF